MASYHFEGHILPGSFFIVFSCWWIANIFYRFYKCKQQKEDAYKNTAAFPCPFSSKYIPSKLESYVKIISAITGILAEIFNGFADGEGWGRSGNIHHMCMYFQFGFNGAVEVFKLPHTEWDIPAKFDYLTLAFAFGAEGFLFYHHNHSLSPMNIMMHTFLFYAIIGCSLACLFEMVLESNIVSALFRALFTLLQGTWFLQIAFILYFPFGEKWDEHDHSQVMMLPSLFLLHFHVNFIIIMIIGVVVKLFVLNSDRKLNTQEVCHTPKSI